MKNYLILYNPLVWLNWLKQIQNISIFAIFYSFSIFLYLIINIETPDIQQSFFYLIMYIHIPVAWYTIQIYLICVILAICDFFFESHAIFNITIKALVPVGAYFAIMTIASGMLWGYPVWGIYWTWDPRLTSTLFLLVLYLLYYTITYINKDNQTISNILLIFGIINIPIIKYSVTWWNSLHQTSSVTASYTTISYSYYLPLVITLILFFSQGLYIFISYYQLYLIKYRIKLTTN